MRIDRSGKEVDDGSACGVFGDAGRDVSVTLHRTQDRGLFRAAPSLVWFVIIVLAVLFPSWASADIGFIRFDDALEQGELIGSHSRPDALLHIPGCLLSKVQVPGQLAAGQAFLGVHNQGNCAEPLLKRHLRLLHDGLGQYVEAGLADIAVPASKRLGFVLVTDTHASAKRAVRLVSKPYLFKMVDA